MLEVLESKDPKWIEELNSEQREAVLETDGPLLILSGAGTGKTKVLTSRIAYILHSGKCSPSNILALTFTNKAGKEMQERISNIVGGFSQNMWVGTFHSMFLRILRKYYDKIGFQDNFTILDQSDSKRVVKKVLEQDVFLDSTDNPAGYVLDVISRIKDKGRNFDSIPPEYIALFDGKMQDIYMHYQRRLKEMNAIDFGDFLLYTYEILKNNDDILEYYQDKFKYILVDEYQDTNVVQYLIIRLLAQKNKNICVVGDDDQSIYSWRGAEVENILRFEKDFSGTKIVRLETNYRSTKHILASASHLVDNNSNRLGKELKPCDKNNKDTSLKVQVRGCFSGEEEAKYIADELENIERQGIPLKKMSVMVRAGWQTRAFEEVFIKRGINYKIIGGMKFYERKEIKDIIAYLKILYYPSDIVSFERVINTPKRGLGEKTVFKMVEYSRELGKNIIFALSEMIDNNYLKGKAGDQAKNFLKNYYEWINIISGDKLDDNGEEYHHGKLVDYIIKSSGYLDMLKNSKKSEDEGKIENIQELIGVISKNFDSIPEFLDHISLVSDTDDLSDDNAVNVMTLHSGKGLEFDVVFLPGWEEGVFPNGKVIEDCGDKGLEEERRIAYVGITRGKKAVFITYAGSRLQFGKWQQNLPSQFLSELPKAHIEHRTFAKSYGGS
ncbi:MAG: UvrD-helicase domain-containing protein [Alphaproteobacteria bacterium]|nr:UvrD-helicase domain-containing protein [Alphaproteobacteria bacterium]